VLPSGCTELLAVPRKVPISEIGFTRHVNLLAVQVECLIEVPPLHIIHTLLAHGLRRNYWFLSFGWLDNRSHVLLNLLVVTLPLVETEGMQTDLLEGVPLVRLMNH
jgi:hypothetical protein